MKIAILVDELAPGSAPKLIGWPIRKLKELGVEAQALVIIEKDYWQKHKAHYDYHLSGVNVRYLFPKFPKWIQKINFKFPGFSFFSLHHIASCFFAYKSIKPNEFDIIISLCQYSTFAARNIKKYCKIPFLSLIWDPSVYTARKIYKKRLPLMYPFIYLASKLLDRFSLAKCDAIITSGKFHHLYLRKITNKSLEILAPGCFAKEQLPEFSLRKRMILTYDRWDIGNIPTIFLDILENVKDKEVSLTIGGFWHPQSLKDEFILQVEERGLEKRVNLLGPLGEEKIMELCSKAMVYVHPVHEAFGMQALEAAGCGCPIVIPAGSGVADLFQDGISGFFPPQGDFRRMVDSINKIFSDKVLAEKMGKAAWSIAKKYTWFNYAKTLKDIANKYLKEE